MQPKSPARPLAREGCLLRGGAIPRARQHRALPWPPGAAPAPAAAAAALHTCIIIDTEQQTPSSSSSSGGLS